MLDWDILTDVYTLVKDQHAALEGQVDNLPRLRGREKSSGECGVCHWA